MFLNNVFCKFNALPDSYRGINVKDPDDLYLVEDFYGFIITFDELFNSWELIQKCVGILKTEITGSILVWYKGKKSVF